MFERYIYIWDIHGSKRIVEFLQKENDWKTFFIFLGDLFDRWSFSYEVFKEIEKLYKQWRIWGCLWNHDLFLIFSQLSNVSREKNKQMFKIPWNWGPNTFKSFENNIKYRKKENIPTWAYLIYVSNFLLENFWLYYIDELNNLSIHWWIPSFFDWELVWESFEYNKFTYWLDYVKKINSLMKEKDDETLEKLTSTYSTDSIIRQNNLFWESNYWMPLKYESKDYWMFVPNWYLNREYTLNKKINESVINELNRNKLNRLFVGHDWNNLINIKNIQNSDRIIRLDYNIWIVILNKENQLIDRFIIVHEKYNEQIKQKKST